MSPSRRDMIRLALAGAATAGMAAPASAQGPAPERPFGIAVVGLGDYGGYIMEELRSAGTARLTGLVSGTPEKLVRFGARYGIDARHRYSYEGFDRIAEDPGIDAVWIALPVRLHAEWAIRAMQAGKHVLVEKPLAATSADGRRMIEVSRRTGRALMVAYRARFCPLNRMAAEMAAKKELGPLTSIMAHKGFKMALPAGNWRFDRKMGGGGTLMDIGIYSVHAMRWVAGAEPLEVQALAHSDSADPRFREVEQSIAWTARFPGGALGSGTASWNYDGQNVWRAAFADGYADLDPATADKVNRLTVVRRQQGYRGFEERFARPTDQLPALADAFAQAVRSGQPLPFQVEEGLRDLLMIEAIYEAARTGRTVKVAAV